MKAKVLMLSLLFCSLSIFSQEKIKTGFGFGAIPAVSFDSDLGFQYGAIVNLFHYGDGSRYPKYDHSLYMEWSRYTKGTGINRIMYDSEKLIPGIRTTVDVTYFTDQMINFYGFNGYQSIYDENKSRLFNSMERNMFRAKADFQGNFGVSNFGWVGGYSFYNFTVDTVNIDKLGLEAEAGGSLYQRYVSRGIIDADEANGGYINYLKIGLKYDSRDQQAFASKGIWTEAVVQSALGLGAFNPNPHTKFALIHRQYFPIIKNDMVFAYRLTYQATLGKNKVPFYAQPLLITSFLTAAENQGLGGKRSLRGVLRNRVVGDDIAFGNFEFRYKFLKFTAFNQNFYLGTNVFFDSGIILKPIAIEGYDTMTQTAKDELMLQDYEKGKFHNGAGIGLKIGWNENFIISVDHGRSLNKEDGVAGTYINLNYMF